MSLNQKAGRFYFKINGMLMLVAALVIWGGPAMAEAVSDAGASAKLAPCKGLKPFNNLDELLYQFYINLESDCLFIMPVEELEKVWDIKILSYERAKPGETITQLRSLPDFYNKPYKTEKDSFYLEHSTLFNATPAFIKVFITKEYYEKHATLFPNGNFPKFLPDPLIAPQGLKFQHDKHRAKPVKKPKKTGLYSPANEFYHWLNSDKTHIIFLGGIYGITSVTIESGWKHYKY